jgi:hypothetical protein
MLSAEHLWKFIMHGEMVLYANNEDSIGIVSPVYNVPIVFILVQVKKTEHQGVCLTA